jgi:hypothetical protein
MRRLRERVTYANVMSTLAVFVALGGSAVAVGVVPFAKRAGNANRVDGLHASRTPKKGTLLALDPSAKFPVSVLPAAAIGPVGPAGAKGDAGPAGPQGATGPKGDAGTPATKLFAYIRDSGSADPAVVQYGNAVSVTDPAGQNNFISPYTVDFGTDLTNCVAMVTPGTGQPAGAASDTVSASIAQITTTKVNAAFFNTSNTANDTSFMIAVFC